MEIKTYEFNLYDAQDGSLVMGTEVDEIPEPKIDAEFWQRFLRGDCAMIFMGEKTEKIDDYINEEILRGKRDIDAAMVENAIDAFIGGANDNR